MQTEAVYTCSILTQVRALENQEKIYQPMKGLLTYVALDNGPQRFPLKASDWPQITHIKQCTVLK